MKNRVMQRDSMLKGRHAAEIETQLRLQKDVQQLTRRGSCLDAFSDMQLPPTL